MEQDREHGESDQVVRTFKCSFCKTVHEITLNRKLAEGRTRFPFAHIYLHGELKDILTILYIDKDLEIRGVELERLAITDENIVSKEHMLDIIEKLVKEIEELREDFNKVFSENQELKKNSQENPFLTFIKDIGEGIAEGFKNLFNL